MSAPLFTVFTPTFNRAATLPAVFASLSAQTRQDFEWLIVDDGSTDDTRALVTGWASNAPFPVRYFWQENAGKHVAFNHGVRQACGALFLPLDSDDTIVPEALAIFEQRWSEIPKVGRAAFSGVTCQCLDERGAVVGTPLPVEVVDGYPLEVRARFNLIGERFGFHRADVLREFPFPFFDGERFVPEGLVWNRIGQRFKMRFVADALRIYRHSADGLSASVTRVRRNSPRGTTLYYLETLDLPLPFFDKIRNAINGWRFALSSTARKQVYEALRRHFLLLCLSFPLGRTLALIDRRRRQ